MNVRSKEQWFELFGQHEKSGLSMADFCRRKKLNKKYFSLRRIQLDFKINQQKLVGKTSVKDFIKVSVKPNESSGLSLVYRELKLNWDQLPPADWLSDFVKTLK